MSDAIAATETQFKRGDGASPEVFTHIGEVITVPLPNLDSEEIDVTHLNSPSQAREYLLGFKDSGILELPMNFVRTDYEVLLDDYDTQDIHNYQIVLSDETTFEFAGYVKGLGGEAGTGKQVTATVRIRITGGVELVSA